MAAITRINVPPLGDSGDGRHIANRRNTLTKNTDTEILLRDFFSQGRKNPRWL